MEYSQLRIRTTTLNKLKALLAKYIGIVGKPVSMIDFIDLLSSGANKDSKND